MSLVGIELLSIEARVVIASVETYLKYAEAIGLTASAPRPPRIGDDQGKVPARRSAAGRWLGRTKPRMGRSASFEVDYLTSTRRFREIHARHADPHSQQKGTIQMAIFTE